MMAWRRPTGRANATSSGHWSSGWKWLGATSILYFGSIHIRVITIPKKKVCNFVGGEGIPACGISHPCQQQPVKEFVQHGYTHKSLKRATDNPSEKGREYREVRWVSPKIHVQDI